MGGTFRLLLKREVMLVSLFTHFGVFFVVLAGCDHDAAAVVTDFSYRTNRVFVHGLCRRLTCLDLQARLQLLYLRLVVVFLVAGAARVDKELGRLVFLVVIIYVGLI